MFFAGVSFAQETDVVLSPYNKWNEAAYYRDNSLQHTAFHYHLYIDTSVQRSEGSVWKRKIFNEHLLTFGQDEFHLFVDFLPDFQIGTSSGRKGSNRFWNNTRGFRISGNVGKKIYFESEDYEIQESLPGYVDSSARKLTVVPRLGNHHKITDNGVYDLNYASARLVYMPTNAVQFELGYGKNFIGDGYRSMLLSDWSFNYPYLRATLQTKAIEYSVMWSQYVNPGNAISTNDISYPRKWGQTFYIDWHFAKHGNVGLMESIVWPDQTADGEKDIAATMFSPVIFLHGTHSPSGIENYTLTGLNAKYEILPQTFLYGQLAYSNFLRSNWKQKYAFQLGLRSADIFQVKGLSFIGEFDRAKPYMYAGNAEGIDYSHYNQTLADPFGNNFKEAVAVVNYRIKKWTFRGEALYSSYFRNSAITPAYLNAGGSIFGALPGTPGIKTKLHYGDLRAGYLLNPKINLRIEGGITVRKSSDVNGSFKDNIFVLGLRSSFRDLIEDF
ncbi:hypothetical protein [Arachidicoccus ginsenosidimutans]|uniref:hypothetical protein n=1 Tax=Arachidicoccus sp. BS20 TaxID=1850526 RepID=UPI0012E8373B|nr:hypothetical protein [Arachidicoccus sp. BS20]